MLWNAVSMHPHRLDNVWSNRTPTDDELALGVPALIILREAFPAARFVAVGKKAEGVLAGIGIDFDTVRHLANGGATRFGDQLAAL